MTKREIREAYRAFNRASHEAYRLQRCMREADKLIAHLEVQRRETLVRELTDSLQDDAAFCRVLRGYTGNSPRGWACACGCDGRMRRLLNDPGWDILAEVIRRIKWRKYAPKGKLSSRDIDTAVSMVCKAIDAENGKGG